MRIQEVENEYAWRIDVKNSYKQKLETVFYIHLYSPYMVERNKQTYIYKQINKTDRENKQQSINIAGIHLNGKIIKLSLISNGTYLNWYITQLEMRSKA